MTNRRLNLYVTIEINLLTRDHRDRRTERQQQAATSQQLPRSPCINALLRTSPMYRRGLSQMSCKYTNRPIYVVATGHKRSRILRANWYTFMCLYNIMCAQRYGIGLLYPYPTLPLTFEISRICAVFIQHEVDLGYLWPLPNDTVSFSWSVKQRLFGWRELRITE